MGPWERADTAGRQGADPPGRGTESPALAAAGAAVLGVGAWALLDPGPARVPAAGALLVLGAGALALFGGRGGTAFGRSAALALLAAAGLGAARAASAPQPAAARAGTLYALESGRSRAPAGTWAARSADAVAGLRPERGAARRGDLVVPLGVSSPRWAAAPEGCAAPRAPVAARVRADELVRVQAGAEARAGPGSRLRARGVEAARTHRDPVTRGLLVALLFGDTADLPPGLADLFTRTGTRHMLALSGLHVGLVGVLVARPLGAVIAAMLDAALAACAALLGRRGAPHVDPAWPTALLALLFVPLAGYGAPASRAALALALAVLAPRLPRALGGPRRPSALNLLGLALSVELLLDPLAPLAPGVQLSYAATAALILVGSRAAVRAEQTLPGLSAPAAVTRTGRARWPLGRALLLSVRRASTTALAASVAASLATLPTVWSTFGEFAPVGALATPAAFLPMAALVGVGWCFVVCPAGWALHGLLAAATEGAARAMLDVLVVLDGVPLSPWALPSRSVLLVAAFSGGALLCLAAAPGALRQAAGRTAALALAVLVAPWPSARAPGLEVTLPDVGDGLSVLVRAPDGAALLLDAGSSDRIGVATQCVLPLLRARDVGPLTVALSHDHRDHAGDLERVVRRRHVKCWVGDSAARVPPPAGARWIQPAQGSTVASTPGSRLEVVALRGGPFAGNEGSLALDLRWHGAEPARVVLCGDAEGHGLATTLAEPWGFAPGPVDLLLLPHHGSDSPHLGALLDRLRPREVWISSSSPAPPALEEVERRGIRARVTGRDGPLVRVLGGRRASAPATGSSSLHDSNGRSGSIR